MEKQCLDCGATVKGRSDKKFCDDQCRSNYNNRIKADGNVEVKKINNILLKNRKILAQLNIEGKTKLPKSKLEKASFNFNYFTHTYETSKGSCYKFCYDQGYLTLENDWFLLVKKQES
ncbi:hypothetical protein [Pedobacter alpinus]|uniref:DUF2116 family Zn-ribbon domain-containing protein n=1 Tax=Pedobacter alpinus TaxID=1590643 RepID=A0ABW5TSF5_9SPHI